MTIYKLTQEDRNLIHRIEFDIKNNPDKYREAGKWLDEKFDDEYYWEDFEINGISGCLACLANPSLSDEERKKEEEDLQELQMIFNKREKPHKSELITCAIYFFINEYSSTIFFDFRSAKTICLIMWILSDPDAENVKLGLTQFEDWDWKYEDYADVFEKNKLARGEILFRCRVGDRTSDWMEIVRVAWLKVETQNAIEIVDKEKSKEQLTEEEAIETTQNQKIYSKITQDLYKSLAEIKKLIEIMEKKQKYILEKPISDFELSDHTRNCLKTMKIYKLGDLLNITEAELLSYVGFGEKSLKEVKAVLESKSMYLGMQLTENPFGQSENEVFDDELQTQPQENGGEDEINSQFLNIAKESVMELIKRSECHYIEFKATLEYDIDKNEYNKALNKECLKTIAAFLNADGGVLLIGVRDDGTIIGIEQDLQYVQRKNPDGFQLKLRDLIQNSLKPFPHRKIEFFFENVNQATVCRVNVKPVKRTQIVYLENNLYIREGNKTINLKGTVEIADWIQQRNNDR
jgi:hypothetical protein